MAGTLATIPSGYRPSFSGGPLGYFPAAGQSIGVVNITNAGLVSYYSGSGGLSNLGTLGLDGMTYTLS